MYLAFLQALLEQGDVEKDPKFRAMVESSASKVGVKLADDVRKAFKLGDSLQDAIDSWRIGCVTAGIKFTVRKEGDTFIFDHPYCPMHEYFTSKGIVPCSTLCLPMVETIAKEICPNCEVEIVQPGDLQRTCIKALKLRKADPFEGESR
jgi:hypothetical protein